MSKIPGKAIIAILILLILILLFVPSIFFLAHTSSMLIAWTGFILHLAAIYTATFAVLWTSGEEE